MKTIGFIDYYLDEFHSGNFIKKANEYNEINGTDYVVCCAWAEIDSPSGMTNAQWCEAHGVELCASLEEVCRRCDFIVLLAPDNPEKHLPYAKEIFKIAKTVFIDKTFSAGYEDAKEIFRLADENGARFMSTSSLRYETAFAPYKDTATAITVYGGGGVGHYFDDYLVHHLEIVMHCFGLGATNVHYERCADQELVRVEFTNNRVANVIFAPCLGFGAIVADENGESRNLPAQSDYFKGQITDVLNFFGGAEPSFDTRQTLELAKIRAAAFISRDKGVHTVNLADL